MKVSVFSVQVSGRRGVGKRVGTGGRALAALISIIAITVTTAGEAQVNKEEIDIYQGYMAGKFKGMPYRWMKPIDYDKNKAYPLVLSLHGRAGVGTDNKKSLRAWNTQLLNQDAWREKYPCFVVAPQNTFAWVRPKTIKDAVKVDGENTVKARLPREKQRRRFKSLLSKPDYSSLEIVFDLIKKFQEDFNIDTNRIYVIGNSMGGYGAWAAMQEEPDLFAAGIPLCGGPYVYLPLERIKDVPVWAFHGTNDKTVPYALSKGAFETLKKARGNCKFTTLEGLGHGIWNVAFKYKGDSKGYVTEYASDKCDKESNVWEWLFKQRKLVGK